MKQDLWPDLKFPPINLHNVWPTDAQCDIHMQHFIKTWYSEQEAPSSASSYIKHTSTIHEGAQKILNYARGGSGEYQQAKKPQLRFPRVPGRDYLLPIPYTW